MTQSRIGADVWMEEQMFEEDLRAVLKMMRPNGRERLMGWQEYRTGGADFRATISWDPQFGAGDESGLVVPRMAQILESILVGSARAQDDLTPDQEFGLYLGVVMELLRRLIELNSRYR